MSYDFKGNNAALVSSIHALLALDAKGALAPHGIGEMARQLLEASSARLAEQHQGEPVAWMVRRDDGSLEGIHDTPRDMAHASYYRMTVSPLYIHADSGEIEQLRAERDAIRAELDSYYQPQFSITEGSGPHLWSVHNRIGGGFEFKNVYMYCRGVPGLDQQEAMLMALISETINRLKKLRACKKPSATVPCHDCADASTAVSDERAAFERAYSSGDLLDMEGPYDNPRKNQALAVWMTRAALSGFKPTVLSKCVLCDQLQADLTTLDEKLDQTQDLLRCMVYDYRSVVQAGYDRITALGSDCDSVAKMLDDNPNYRKALALLLPDLESRPEERGTPETEPCSGCGTPGWTGACNKCVPY